VTSGSKSLPSSDDRELHSRPHQHHRESTKSAPHLANSRPYHLGIASSQRQLGTRICQRDQEPDQPSWIGARGARQQLGSGSGDRGGAYPSLRGRAPVHAERQRRGAVVAVLRRAERLLPRRRRRHRRPPPPRGGRGGGISQGVAPTIPVLGVGTRRRGAAEPDEDAPAVASNCQRPRPACSFPSTQPDGWTDPVGRLERCGVVVWDSTWVSQPRRLTLVMRICSFLGFEDISNFHYHNHD
jgi:hypothetical protein